MDKGVSVVGILSRDVPHPRHIRKLHSYHLPFDEVFRRMERLTHEILHIFSVYPCRPYAYLDFGCIQLLWLHRFKRGYVYGILRVMFRAPLRRFKLLPDVSAQIFVRRFPSAGHRILEDDPRQFILYLFYALSGQFRHIVKVNPCFFRQRYRKRFCCRINARDDFRLLDRALVKHISLAFKAPFPVYLFQRAEQAVG